MKTDKIVIVGGGSAGWMTAATLIRAFPNKDISVIESPNVPTIGVGESTLGQINRWTRYIGLDEKDFMPFCDATYKLSIQFTDFYEKDSGSFHYPFGSPDSPNDDNAIRDWHIMREFFPEVEDKDMVEDLFPGAQLWQNNKFYLNKDGRLGNFNSDGFVAYHFDALKFGQWLKERYCIPRGVKYISAHINRIDTDENGITELVMDDMRITADLFIDCTGFRSLLMAGALEEPFVSYNDILYNNSAWACQIPYKDKYTELQMYTNCTAIETGWCWNIPLWSRIGTGYNYSDRYISDEDALEQFKNYLCSDKMLIPRTREEVETFTFRNLKTRIGIHERTFVKNVVSLGLSAGFIEPLESNGLFSVHEFLFALVDILQRDKITQLDRTWYNTETRDMFDGFAKFVALHYSMSHRDDTPYWKDLSEMEWTEVRGDTTNNHPWVHRTATFDQSRIKFFDVFNQDINEGDGVTYISTGMGYRYFGGPRLDQLMYLRGEENVTTKAIELHEQYRERVDRWKLVANESPHIVDFLYKNFYSE
jgi:hypothetical protein